MKIMKNMRKKKPNRRLKNSKGKKMRKMKKQTRRKKLRLSNNRDLRMSKPRRISKVHLIVPKTLVSIPSAPTTILTCCHNQASKDIIFLDIMASTTWTRSKSMVNLRRFRN